MKALLLAARVVLVRPGLWTVAVRQWFVLARSGWWRRPPFLPVPDPAYLRFRLQTMYGGDPAAGATAAAFSADDLVAYLQWCRSWPGIVAGQRHGPRPG